jgi:hypothetical protein
MWHSRPRLCIFCRAGVPTPAMGPDRTVLRLCRRGAAVLRTPHPVILSPPAGGLAPIIGRPPFGFAQGRQRAAPTV